MLKEKKNHFEYKVTNEEMYKDGEKIHTMRKQEKRTWLNYINIKQSRIQD